MLNHLFFFVLSVCAVLNPLWSQPWQSVQHFHSDNGLAQNSVWDIYQDHIGYLWIGTANGINRWDGTAFQHFIDEPGKEGGPGGTTGFRFFEDQYRQLWVTHDKGLSLYLRESNRFKQIPGITDYSVCLDEYKGFLYFRSGNRVGGINLQTHKVNWLNLKIGGPRLGVDYTAASRGGVIGHYLCIPSIDSNLYIIDLRSQTLSKRNMGSASIIMVPINRQEAFLIVDDEIYKVRSEIPSSIEVMAQNKNLFKEFNIAQGIIHQGDLWLATEKGIGIYDTSHFQLKYRVMHPIPNRKDPSFVYCLFADAHQNLYLGTNTEGFYITSPTANRFHTLMHPDVSRRMVKAIDADPEGNVYSGQFSGGIICFQKDGQFRELIWYHQDKTRPNIWGLKYLPNEQLLAVSDLELYLLDAASGKLLQRKRYSNAEINPYPQFREYNGQILLNLSDRSFSRILAWKNGLTFDTLVKVPGIEVTSFLPLSNFEWLIGSNTGLFRYSPKGILTELIPQTWVKHIFRSRSGEIYIGTVSGVWYMASDKAPLQTFSQELPFTDQFFYAIQEDRKGDLWFSTNKGLFLYHPKTKKLEHFDRSYGISSSEFNTGAFGSDRTGNLYFGGVQGITMIPAKGLYRNLRPPATVIRKLMVNDEPLNLSRNIEVIKTLWLSHQQNTISMEMASLDFSIPERNTYAYYLEPIEKEWVSSGTRAFVRYSNLSPGKYVLHLRSANPDGIAGPERTMMLEIEPPFWQRWWFYALEALALALILFLIFRGVLLLQKARARAALELQERLEQERLRISRDLHDHVGSQLSFLLSGVEWLQKHQDKMSEADWNQRLQSLETAGRNAMQTLREAIWAISRKEITLEELLDRFKQYALRASELSEKFRLHFSEDFNAHPVLNPVLALHLFRLCQEALHNAFKHSEGTEVHIHFFANETGWYAEIADNGKGFQPGETGLDGHYGLQNMAQRAKEAGMVLEIHSDAGRGTWVKMLWKGND